MDYNDYLLQHDKIGKRIKEIENSSIKIAVFRFISGAAMILLLLCGYFLNKDYLYIGTFLMLGVFVVLVFWHTKMADRLIYLRARLVVIEKYIARFGDKWKDFDEDGTDYLETITGVMKDLDIVGNNSLFQYLNTAVTLRGKKKLLDKLSRTAFDKSLIIQEQEAIK